MCQKCVDAMKKYFPEIHEDQYGDILMNYTSFPFGDAEQIEAQVKHLLAVGREQVSLEIDAEMDAAVKANKVKLPERITQC
jgi:hypothetical protein